MDYEAEIVLKDSCNSACAFDEVITVTKEMFYDFDAELTFKCQNGEILDNLWGKCFVKDFVSNELLNWLKDKEFYMTAFKGDNKMTKHMLHFIKEEDRLHYLLKFVGNQ